MIASGRAVSQAIGFARTNKVVVAPRIIVFRNATSAGSKGVNGNAHIRSEDRSVRLSVGSVCSIICPMDDRARHAILPYIYIIDSHCMRSLLQRTPRLTEHEVIDDLELLIAEMAHQAHRYQCSLVAATRQLRSLVAEAREEYRSAGPSSGDGDRGFCRWLLARPYLSLAWVTPSQ